jgi:hypothetical protein
MQIKYGLICCYLFTLCYTSNAQLVLTADGPGNTYERINAALAPGYDVVENPECVHGSFGRHIAEVFDTDINQYAFEFYAHVTPDNDRCINFDRQRIEIKTYDQSPDSLIGTTGEFITYKWRFKIPVGFQPSSSFSHLHQVKAVGGDDDQPIFTLTARKGNPNKMELIHVVSGTSGSSKVSVVNLSLFEGVWVEATEQLLVGINGTYSINIKRVSDGVTILNYTNANINTIRADNDFIRPKWGIYRSLNTPADLRDESIRFSYFSIKEGLEVLPATLTNFTATQNDKFSVNINWETSAEINTKKFAVERSADGNSFQAITIVNATGNSQGTIYKYKDASPLKGNNYYRLEITDHSGATRYSETRLVKFTPQNELNIYPNPVYNKIELSLVPANAVIQLWVTAPDGKILFAGKSNLQQLNTSINDLLPAMKPGIYFIKVKDGTMGYNKSFIKK